MPPRGLASSLALAVVLAACDGSPPRTAPGGPGDAALGLFELARTGEPDPAALARAFADLPGEEAELAMLLDALEQLGRAPRPRVVGVVTHGADDDAFVDLEADLPGGGVARYTARLADGGSGSWRVLWFQGPDSEWPVRRARPGGGLTVSAPPAPDRPEALESGP